jgi:hypothetical protein
MFFIRPRIADSLSSNLTESAPTAWSGGTTYASGVRAGIVTGTIVAVYKSLRDSNLNNNPTAGGGWWAADGATYLAWSSGTTYALADRVIDVVAHRVYESLQATNLNHGLSDPAWWLDVGPTNALAIFDSVNGTVTVHPYRIDVSQSFTGRIDSLALLNLANAVSARVIMSTDSDGTVYDRTFALVSTAGIDDWWKYFFEDVGRKDTLLVSALPTFANPTIQVVIEGNGSSPVQCGWLSIGLAKDIGEAGYDGAQVGIVDYSRKEADAFGNFDLVERPYSKRATFRCRLQKSAVDGVHAALALYRATPVVYAASADYGATVIPGFFREFSIDIDTPLWSQVSIDIEGLT